MSPSFLADENIDRDIIRGIMRVLPELDIFRAQEMELSGMPNPAVLEAAAQNGMVLLTHDRKTMIGYACERLKSGNRMPDMLVIPTSLSVGDAIAGIVLIAECSRDDEWEGQVRYLPL